MSTPTPYAQAALARESRAQELRLGRRASRAEAFGRAAILAAALATLALALNQALHAGSQQVTASITSATGVASTR